MNVIGTARKLTLAAALIAAVPAVAVAQANVGAQVVDTSGNPVGTVIGKKGDTLTVRTDRHDVTLPASSFTPNEGKLLFGMTQAQLNAETDKALAAASASLVVGAEVRGSGGTVAGTIDALDADTVTITLPAGGKVRLPRNGIAGTLQGPVLGVTADELKALAANGEQAPAADVAVDATAGAGAQ